VPLEKAGRPQAGASRGARDAMNEQMEKRNVKVDEKRWSVGS